MDSSGSERRYDEADDEGIDLAEVFAALKEKIKAISLAGVLCGAAGLGVAFLIPPTFVARAVILPPQQQSAAASALGSLGALAGLAGGVAGIKSPGEQYVALLQSATVADTLIDGFHLLDVYEKKFREDARKKLADLSVIAAGKKDGLITIEVGDRDPVRAAAMANGYVDGLRRLTTTLAVSEAQQRRVFFEQQLTQSKTRLTQAQIALQGSGFNAGAIKVEPKAAAESYARIRAEVTASEVKVQTMRRVLTDNAPELAQEQAKLGALRGELARLERRDASQPLSSSDADYISKYREYKYQETLFELFARQYELARVDESREGALIQVVDKATPPERKSKPKRGAIAVGAALAGLLLASAVVLVRHFRGGSK